MNMPSGKTTFWLAPGAVLIVLLAAWAVMRPSDDAQAQMAGGPQGPVPVNVVEIEPRNIRLWKEFPGRLVAVDSAMIRPQVSGRITEIHFEDGRRVEAGDLLFVIDPRPYEAALDQAKAALQLAQSGYKQADKDFDRAKELIKTNAVSERIYDERRSKFNAVLAEIHVAKAQVEKAEIDLDYAYVKAPISGRVGRAEITVGNLVEAGLNAPVVTEIIADEKIYADFDVDEQTYLSHIREQAGDQEQENHIPVQVVLRGNEDTLVDGEIYAFDNRINPASGTIRARAILDNENGAMLPGMFARIRLGSAEREQTLSVPEKAVGTDQDRKFVYVVENGQVAYRQITMGDRVGPDRVVTQGLQAGDQVIVDGILKLRPGMPVQPVVQPAAAPQQDPEMPAPPAADEPEPQAAPKDEKSSVSIDPQPLLQDAGQAPAEGGADE